MNFRAENSGWHHGFQMTFNNGCTISVQFSKGNYCDEGETTAEVAAWNRDNNWMTWEGTYWKIYPKSETDIMSHQTTDDVAVLISELAKFKP